jgi:hypothetical protein
VAIVATCLGKSVKLHANDYHKNKSVYQTSLDGFPNVTFIDREEPPAPRPAAGRAGSFTPLADPRNPRWHCFTVGSPMPRVSIRATGSPEPDFSHLTAPSIPAVGVLRLREASVNGINGLIETEDGERLTDLSWPSHISSAHLEFPPLPARRLEGTIASIGSPWASSNHAHFLFDVLGRISLLRKLDFDFGAIDHFLCPPPPSALCNLLLSRSGIPPQKLLWLAPGKAYRAAEVIVPTYPGAARWYVPGPLDYVRSLGRGAGQPAGTGRRIFIERPAHSRDFINKREILEVLAAHSFEVFGPSQFNSADLFFSDAELVVGTHGAGLANIAFCREGTGVLEIVPSAWQSPFYLSSGISLGLRYHCLSGQSRGCQGLPDIRLLNQPIRVEPDALDQAIRAMAAGTPAA